MRVAESSNVEQMDRQTSAAVRRGVAEVLRQSRMNDAEDRETNLPPHLQHLLSELTKLD